MRSTYTCALLTNGGVRCWGCNTNGAQSDPGVEWACSEPPLTRPPDTDMLDGVLAIAAGRAHTCALMTTGGVRCWGWNGWGQLGDDTQMDRATPFTNDVLGDVQAIATGSFHSCAVMKAGGVMCWGFNQEAELGDGTSGQLSLHSHTGPGALLVVECDVGGFEGLSLISFGRPLAVRSPLGRRSAVVRG